MDKDELLFRAMRWVAARRLFKATQAEPFAKFARMNYMAYLVEVYSFMFDRKGAKHV